TSSRVGEQGDPIIVVQEVQQKQTTSKVESCDQILLVQNKTTTKSKAQSDQI
ncbi:unnamed protein product, partial [Amoebophrya sp. A25]